MSTNIRTALPFLPYGRQYISDDDINAVVEVLRSDWLTQGPTIERFEEKLAESVGARYAVACCNGTAALHLAMLAAGLGSENLAITTPITFMATANCARYVGASVGFVDVDRNTALMNPEMLAEILKKDTEHRIKAILPVHFAGQPVQLPEFFMMAKEHEAFVIDDGCHAIGGSFSNDGKNVRIGSGDFSDMTVFSFHPVKHIATGEGGAVTTNNSELMERLKRFRNHGIERESFENNDLAFGTDGKPNRWYHELCELGYNYRLNDIQAALGISQLPRLEVSVAKRNEIALVYDNLIAKYFDSSQVRPLGRVSGMSHAYHLYVLQIDFESFGTERSIVMRKLSEAKIGSQVHYIPVHLQPYYKDHAPNTNCPEAISYYSQALSIPMYPELTVDDCERVVNSLQNALKG